MYLEVCLKTKEGKEKWIELTECPDLEYVLEELGVSEDDVYIDGVDTDIDCIESDLDFDELQDIIDVFDNVQMKRLDDDFELLLQLGLPFNDTYEKMLDRESCIFEADSDYDISVFVVDNDFWKYQRCEIPEDIYEVLDFDKIGEKYHHDWVCDFIDSKCVAFYY